MLALTLLMGGAPRARAEDKRVRPAGIGGIIGRLRESQLVVRIKYSGSGRLRNELTLQGTVEHIFWGRGARRRKAIEVLWRPIKHPLWLGDIYTTEFTPGQSLILLLSARSGRLVMLDVCVLSDARMGELIALARLPRQRAFLGLTRRLCDLAFPPATGSRKELGPEDEVDFRNLLLWEWRTFYQAGCRPDAPMRRLLLQYHDRALRGHRADGLLELHSWLASLLPDKQRRQHLASLLRWYAQESKTARGAQLLIAIRCLLDHATLNHGKSPFYVAPVLRLPTPAQKRELLRRAREDIEG